VFVQRANEIRFSPQQPLVKQMQWVNLNDLGDARTLKMVVMMVEAKKDKILAK